MNRLKYLQKFALVCGLSLLAGGCLIKSAPAPTRHFILTPLAQPGGAQATTHRPAIEVTFVRMPSYLLRDSMVIRKSASEIEVLDDAIWAERLDEGFRRILENNLSSLLASDELQPTSGRNEATVRVSVDVQQFDVDTEGQGTLLASWRLTEAGAASAVKTGEARLTHNGSSPRGNPQAIATTLSALIGEFSRELATACREATEPKS